MIRTTAGQLLINESLPEDLRDYKRTLDSKGIKLLMREVAQRYPDRYVDVSKRLADIGREAATESGGTSIGPEHLSKAKAAIKYEAQIRAQLKQILDRDDLSPRHREELVLKAVGGVQEKQMDEILAESLAEKNPLALQVLSGSRGNKMNLASLRGSDLLYTDHHDNVIPVPVLRSYSQGLSPMEYWTGTYGARRGVLATKFAVRDAGFLSKQLNQVAHRLVVTDDDYEDDPERPNLRGLPVDVGDPDNEGALLARDTGGYSRNTALTPKIMKDLERRGIKRMLVRSSMVGGSPEGGVYSRDVGIRERGVLPGRGEQVGLQAAQALSEPLSQAQLSAKHSGGVAGQEKSVSGFQAINQLIQVPKIFKGGAAHSDVDGKVERVEEAPAGGTYVTIENKQHYVAPGFKLKVKRGDFVESGDVISEGLPDPSVIVHHKGNGEGKRYFMQAAYQAMQEAGLKPHRRNLELLARGLINHVRLTEETDDNVPGDVVPYSTLEHTYKPREGFQSIEPTGAVGKYLERPYLHHSIGTKIRPSMLKDFIDFGVDKVDVHDEPPPFEPEMVRGMYSLHHDPDWLTRFYGSGQKSSLLDAVHRGSTSTELGTSFVPGLLRSVDFGRQGIVKQPQPGKLPITDDDAMPRAPFISPKIALKPLPKLAPQTDWLKAAEDLQQNLDAEARRRVQQIKQAENYDPTGSSGPGGTSLQGGQKTIGAIVDHATAAVGGPPAKNTPQQPSQAAQPTTRTPGKMMARPAWLGGPQQTATTTPDGGTSYERYAKQRAGQYSGYQPGQSMFSATDNPQDVARFVAGHESLDHTKGYGGEFGAATRFLTALDPNAAATLTGGSAYTNNDYGGEQAGGVEGQADAGGAAGGAAVGEAGQEQVNALAPADGIPGGPQADEQSFSSGLMELGRQVPTELNPTMQAMHLLSNPLNTAKVTGYAEAANLAGKGIGQWAPRTGKFVSGVGKVFSPVRQIASLTNVARPGSILTRLGHTVGGKAMGAVSGALNAGWAPAEALYHLSQGDSEAAKKVFWDEDYTRSMGDSNRSYIGRSWDAMDPRRFYNNGLALGRAALSPVTTASGAFDNAAGLIGMDQTSRHNRFVKSDAGKRQYAAEAVQKGNQIFQRNLAGAVADGRAVMQNGRPVPSPTWAQQYRQHNPAATPEDVERAFLNATFRFDDLKTDENGYTNGYQSPDEMWQQFHSSMG